jgi:hypothetical protein
MTRTKAVKPSFSAIVSATAGRAVQFGVGRAVLSFAIRAYNA